MKTQQPKNNNKRSILRICCSCCFSRPQVKSDEILFNSFGQEFTEYEYVIENLAIGRAPKILLDSYRPSKHLSKKEQTEMMSVKHLNTHVIEKLPPVIAHRGPAIQATDTSPQDDVHPNQLNSPRGDHKRKNFTQGNMNLPGHDTYSKQLLHGKRDGKPCKLLFKNESSIMEENSNKVALSSVDMFRVDELAKLKISADVHKSGDTDSMQMNIPSDLQETIAALKIAKPQASPGFRPKNHRTITKSESTTSCDKEINCNLIGYPSDISDVREKPALLSSQTRDRKNVHRMIVERDGSLERKDSTIVFPTDGKLDHQKDLTNEEENMSSESSKFDKLKGQSLKWKIIINKHKDS